jgi:hypothetical protein
MIEARPRYISQLEFVQIQDFVENTSFEEAVQGVDGVIHTASVRVTPPLDAMFHRLTVLATDL